MKTTPSENLFSNHDQNIEFPSIEDFLDNDNNSNKLTDPEANEIEGKITAEELGLVLKKGRNGSAPGSTGFNYSFYKFFWRSQNI